jgi:hypothetical protein
MSPVAVLAALWLGTAAAPVDAAAAPAQDPQVSAALSRDQVAVGETTVLTIMVEGHSGTAQLRVPPVPAGLMVVGTSDFSQYQLSAPGRRVRRTRREIGITAQAPGVYRIEPGTVQVDGRLHRIPAVRLTVSGSAAPARGGDEYREAATTTALRLDVAPDTVYVGQQLMLNAEVIFAEDSRSRQSRPASFEPPAPAGFWVQDLPDPVSVSLRVREGRTVETQSYRRAYFPLGSGEFWFPPAHLHYDLRRGFLQPPESRRVSSDSVRVVVRPLPPQRPSSFHGAVGRFGMTASLAPERIAVGEAAVLVVEVSGRGNVRALPEPRLPAVDGLEVYAPSQESTVDVLRDEVGGRKRFRWMIVPERAGTFTIPPIQYSYFDPELRVFVTLESAPLILETRAVAAAEAADTLLRPLRESRADAYLAWTRTPAFAALQLAPLLLVGAVAAVRRQRRRPPGPRAHARRLRRAVTALRGRGDDERLAALERLLLEAVACVAGGSSAWDEAEASLRRAGRSAEADELAALLADLRTLRYAPHSGRGGGDDLVERARAFIDSLAQRPRSGRVAGVVLLALAAAGAAGAAARQDDAFDRAVQRYHAGDAAAAANGFHAYARAHPHDPSGWFNLGVAAHAAGDPGRAAWAWLRTVRTSPRAADARHNLQVIGAGAAAVQVAPPDRLAGGERMLLAAVAWWLLVIALGAALLSASRSMRWLAAPAALVLLITGAAAAADVARPPVITPLGTGTAVFAGPSRHDDVVAGLPVGSTARLVERRSDWLLVRLDDDRQGWVERGAVAAP